MKKRFMRPSEVRKLVNSLKDRRNITAKSDELKKRILKLKSDNAKRKHENRLTGEEMIVLLINEDPRYLPMLCMKRVYSESLFDEVFLDRFWRYGQSGDYNKITAMKMIDQNVISGKGYRQLDPSLLSSIRYNYLKQLARKKIVDKK